MVRMWVRAAAPGGLLVLALSVAVLFAAAAVSARDSDTNTIFQPQADPGHSAVAFRTAEIIAASAIKSEPTMTRRRTRRLQDAAGEAGAAAAVDFLDV